MDNKKIFKLVILIFVMAIAFKIGTTVVQGEQTIKVENVLYESTENFYIEDGEIGVEFSDGSWCSVNESKGYYIFQPVDLGDWNYSFDNLEDMKNCINTYIENASR